MTGRRKKPTVVVDVGRYRTTVRGPVSVTVAAVRDVVGTAFTLDYDNRAHQLAVKPDHSHDVIAALEARGARVELRGRLPDPELWSP